MEDLKISQLTSAASLTGVEVVPIVQGSSTLKTTVQDIANLAGLGGTNYVFVPANGTDLQNAIDLQAAYDTAKTMSPAVDNRITVVAAPGEYKFASPLTLDTEFIDLVSLTGSADVVFDLVGDPVSLSGFNITNIVYPLVIAADNVYVKGIYGKAINSPNFVTWWGSPVLFKAGIDIGNNLPNTTVENCDAGYFSFGANYTYGVDPSLNKVISGTYINCKSLSISFGHYGTASGKFINCSVLESVENPSVYGYDGFGFVGTVSGYFENCKSGSGSFGGYGTVSGTFDNCKSMFFSFGGSGSGVTSGIFNNCIAASGSFGNPTAELTGKLYYCRLTSGTFQNVSGAGITRLCIDGSNAENNQG